MSKIRPEELASRFGPAFLRVLAFIGERFGDKDLMWAARAAEAQQELELVEQRRTNDELAKREARRFGFTDAQAKRGAE